jgi:hypothetical protein
MANIKNFIHKNKKAVFLAAFFLFSAKAFDKKLTSLFKINIEGALNFLFLSIQIFLNQTLTDNATTKITE